MRATSLTIIGLGFMGGSLAKGARQRGIAARLHGIDPDPAHREIASEWLTSAGERLTPDAAEVDLLVVSTPVDRIADLLLRAADLCRPDTLLTDLGSTKGVIVRQVEERLPPARLFIGGHPLAGSEREGPSHANPDLFKNKLTILTPTERTNPQAVPRATAFWESMGSRVQLLSPEAHDHAVARTSHLPHLTAAALAAMLPEEMADMVASGFRSCTRIAAGSPALWRDIFRQNRESLLSSVRLYQEQVEAMRQALEDEDWDRVEALLEQGRRTVEPPG